MTGQRRSKGHLDTGARERLLVAARRCVRDRGVDRTSSRAIAETAGENLAAITYYFGSKDDLVAAALAEELREWLRPALERLARDDDPAMQLLDAMSILSERFDADREGVPSLV
jgi:AcrR family transcriptional regulator